MAVINKIEKKLDNMRYNRTLHRAKLRSIELNKKAEELRKAREHPDFNFEIDSE